MVSCQHLCEWGGGVIDRRLLKHDTTRLSTVLCSDSTDAEVFLHSYSTETVYYDAFLQAHLPATLFLFKLSGSWNFLLA